MTKLLFLAIIAATLTLLACSAPTPAPTSNPAPTEAPTPIAAPTPVNTPAPTLEPEATATPTPTAEPTNTPSPTPAPEATTTPMPTATRAPATTPEPPPTPAAAPTEPASTPGEAPGDGMIAPLPLDDPEAVASELSDSELACLAGTADTGRLLQIFADPGLATPEEGTQLVTCLEDETLLRIFLTGFIGESGPLTLETSECVRTGFEGIDLRSVMLAGSGGDEEAAMVGTMASFTMTLACLNEEEWLAIAPAMGMDPGERENLLCLMEELGGPEGFAQALSGEDESGMMAFFAASAECELQMDGGSGEGG